MEAKFPFIGHSLPKRDHHCTDMVSRVFYQFVVVGAPYAIVGDCENVLFMEVCKVALDKDKNFTFVVKDVPDPRMLSFL